VLTYVIAKSRKQEDAGRTEFSIPFDLRRRLQAWIDVDEVGPEGFWLWLRAVVPLLPSPGPVGSTRDARDPIAVEGVQDLRRRLVFYAREHARLSVISDQYARDNQTLSRRLRALESALRTLELAGHRVEIPPDEDAVFTVRRYLPTRARRPGRSTATSRNR